MRISSFLILTTACVQSVYGSVSPTQGALSKFTFKDIGYCDKGYYRGWTDDENFEEMTAAKCAEICLTEPYCEYFAVLEGKTCSRYTNNFDLAPQNDEVVGDCEIGSANDHYTWERKKSEIPFSYLQQFSYVKKGYCKTGYYRGWGDDTNPEEMTNEKCAEICASEPYCEYFAMQKDKTCSRYTNNEDLAPQNGEVVGDCDVKTGKGARKHYLYKKKETTEAPTVSPSPTESPSASPTETPTTVAPTKSPSASPSGNPTTSVSPTSFNYLSTFQYKGAGYCTQGVIKDIVDFDKASMTDEICAEICAQDDICKFFSVRDGNNCKTFSDTSETSKIFGKTPVGECNSRLNNNKKSSKEYETWRKNDTPNPTHAPTVSAFPTAYPVLFHEFEYVTDGYCKSDDGKYNNGKGEDDRYTMTAEKCAKKCHEDIQCKFFAVRENNRCVRYTNIRGVTSGVVGECKNKTMNDAYKLYKKINSFEVCQGPTAKWSGDPHFTTFDNLKYDCQGAGEFVALKSSELEVRGRFQHAYDGSKVSITRGVAFKTGTDGQTNGAKVSLTVPDTGDCEVTMHVDDVKHAIETMPTIPGVAEVSQTNDVTFISTTNGASIITVVKKSKKMGCVMSVSVCIPEEVAEEEQDTIVGLLGSPNNNKKDDWMSSDPKIEIEEAPTTEVKSLRFEKAYNYCVDNWCVKNSDETMFTYNDVDTNFEKYNKCGTEKYDNSNEVAYEYASGDAKEACGDDIACIIEYVSASPDDATEFRDTEKTLDRVKDEPLSYIAEPNLVSLTATQTVKPTATPQPITFPPTTPEATGKPTNPKPTKPPTREPTGKPTNPKPTNKPTKPPTREPTGKPTKPEPTDEQTDKRTILEPTNTPTKSPKSSGRQALPTGGNREQYEPGVQGDPHFKTWSGEMYDFHGVCDLVLLQNNEFEKGIKMDIHLRTKKMMSWSFVSVAAIRIGEDILEVMGGAIENNFWINGIAGNKEVVNKNELSMVATLSVYPVFFSEANKEQRQFVIDLGEKEAIVVATWKSFVRVQFKNAKGKHFKHSLGLMGSFSEGAKLARDNITVMEDVNKFGQEWQVRESEPNFFHLTDGPQHPMECEIPSGLELRRRLGEAGVTVLEAQNLCADVSKELIDLCVFDIIATNDRNTAGAY